MNSISFPKMFITKTKTGVVYDRNATMQNLKMLLWSEKGELFGDPYFGTGLLKYIYDQNDFILQDLVIDEIYTAIATFMPQIRVDRRDISIRSDGTKLICDLNVTNLVDFQTDMYSIVLLETELSA